MTKKDYILIAEVIRGTNTSQKTRREIAYELAERLQKDNPRFDRDRFIFAALGE